jgi:hypothetical protein
METEEIRHYFVQVLRIGQVICGLYFAHGRTDGRKEGRTDRRTDGWNYCN